MSTGFSISVILPCYNEGGNITRTYTEIKPVVEAVSSGDYEIIFVNDGSTDQTGPILDSLSLQDKRVKQLKLPRNYGYGKALLAGMQNVAKEWTFITDADLQFFPHELNNFIEFVGYADFIQGYRIKRSDPRSRVLIGKIYKKIVSVFFHLKVRDPECSFRLIKTKLLKEANIRSRGAVVPLELVFQLQNYGARIVEVGVNHRLREHGESNALTLKTFIVLLKELCLLYLRTKFRRSHA